MSDNLADQLFDAHFTRGKLEEDLCQKLLEILGAGEAEWPFADVGWDWYDCSIEIQGANPDLRFTPEQWQQVAALGFDRGWISHTDGQETYLPSGNRQESRSKSRCESDRPYGSKEQRRLARLGAAVEADLIPAVKWFLDNPCDYPGGQDNTGLKQAVYKTTGWQPEWVVFERLEAEPHTTQVVNLAYKLSD